MSENKNENQFKKDEERKNGSKAGSRKASVSAKAIDLDHVLINELGQFGRFQLRNLLLVSVPIIMSAFMSEYIFSSAHIPHRCKIPACGEDGTFKLNSSLLENAIPFRDAETKTLMSCERFTANNNGTPGFCPRELFSESVESCGDGYVYDRDNSVVYDFDLGCQDWWRAFAGTLNSLGTLLVLPFTGYISDRFGRRIALVISVFNLALIGLIRAFSVNYPMYLVLQLLQTTLGAGTFSSAYIFAAELVGPKYRVITSATMSSMFAVGQVILGAVAWVVQPWRYMIMILHIPCFIIIAYYWILSESVRWLMSKEKYEEARAILEKVAKVNKTKISENTMEALLNPPKQIITEQEPEDSLIKQIVKSPVMLRRVCTTPIWWITTTFVYYGLSINSTSLSDTLYLNYIITCAIEIPGFYTAVLILDRIGRKPTLAGGYFLCAAFNIIFVFVSKGKNLRLLKLITYLCKACEDSVLESN